MHHFWSLMCLYMGSKLTSLTTLLAVVVLMITKVYPPEVRAVNLASDWLLRRPGKALVLFAARPAAALARSWNRFTTASPRLLRRNPFPALDRLTFLEETVLVVVLLLLSFLVVLFYS